MKHTTKECLDDLESRLDVSQEEQLLSEWAQFAEGRFEGDMFSPHRERLVPPRIEWPVTRINDALDNFDTMVLQQYGAVSSQIASESGLLPNVRANYGTSIVPLLFGVEPFVMPEELDTLPTSVPLHDTDAVRRLIDAGPPALDVGYGSRVLEMGKRFAAIARDYPNIGRCVHIYHPDLQGPFDVCEVIWGSDIFMAVYAEPEIVHALLELVTDTYIRLMREWEKIVPFREGGNAHWGMFHAGNIMLRDDSAMNVSPELFDEFVRPYDQRLLDAFGGGACHFCGRGDHYIASMCAMQGVHAISLSQPDYNDMETIYAHTLDKGISLIGLAPQAAQAALDQGRDLHGLVHCA